MMACMPATQDLLIQRSTELDLDVDELWALISTAQGWASWLVDDADITISPNSTGTTTVDESERSVRIDSVVEGRRVSFSWWDQTDGDDGSSMSFVELDIIELPDGRSRLNVSEQLGTRPAATASASLSMAIRWDVAMVSLWMLALHSLVMA
jgi:uncharacterized protein YndB with AHSA1/START domain